MMMLSPLYVPTDAKKGGNRVLRWFESRSGERTVHDICMAGWSKGTCYGDYDSPVVVTELNGKPTLVGIATDEVTSCLVTPTNLQPSPGLRHTGTGSARPPASGSASILQK